LGENIIHVGTGSIVAEANYFLPLTPVFHCLSWKVDESGRRWDCKV